MSLTDDDKQWIKEQLEHLATKEQLEHLATKEQLEHLATKEQLEHLATKEQLERFATKEQLERIETALLTAFHKWASPVELRQRSHAAVLRALDAEVESLSDRVKNLEGPR